jgi:hypothetical protein
LRHAGDDLTVQSSLFACRWFSSRGMRLDVLAQKLRISSQDRTSTMPQVSDQLVSPAARAFGVRKSSV